MTNPKVALCITFAQKAEVLRNTTYVWRKTQRALLNAIKHKAPYEHRQYLSGRIVIAWFKVLEARQL